MHHSNERVTMRTLAERLGVTKTTVSLALRGSQSISKKTRDRVVELARELNYRPDPAIAAIAAQRWSGASPKRHRTIAFICHQHPVWKNQQFEYFPAAKKRAEELGFNLEPFFVDEYPSAKSISRVLYYRGIRGILIPPIYNPDSQRIMNLDWDKFTAVCCGIGRVKPPLHTVTSDYFVTTRFVWEVVAKAGFKKIGAAVSCHNPVADDDWQRVGASHAAERFLGLSEADKIPFLTADVLDEAALMEWYTKYKPEIIIAFNQHNGDILERNGVRIPEDVELVCLIAPQKSKWSGLTPSMDQIARTSMDVLHNELRENRWGLPELPNLILVRPEWAHGTSFSRDDLAENMTLPTLPNPLVPDIA